MQRGLVSDELQLTREELQRTRKDLARALGEASRLSEAEQEEQEAEEQELGKISTGGKGMRGELQSARQRLQRARDEQLDAVQLQAELKRARRDSIATKRRLEKLSEELQVLQTELF